MDLFSIACTALYHLICWVQSVSIPKVPRRLIYSPLRPPTIADWTLRGTFPWYRVYFRPFDLLTDPYGDEPFHMASVTATSVSVTSFPGRAEPEGAGSGFATIRDLAGVHEIAFLCEDVYHGFHDVSSTLNRLVDGVYEWQDIVPVVAEMHQLDLGLDSKLTLVVVGGSAGYEQVMYERHSLLVYPPRPPVEVDEDGKGVDVNDEDELGVKEPK